MLDSDRLRPFSDHIKSEMALRQPAADAASVSSNGSRPRHRATIPHIASLDMFSAKISGAGCPSIRSASSPSSSHQPLPSPSEQGDGIFFQGRDHADRSVSLEHMVNTLHHVMMTKPVLAPVPIEHNSCILRLLEGYWDLKERLKKVEQALEEERETKERSIDEFAKVSAEWERKEADFLVEIKRMELVLANVAPDGVGAVVLARSGSVVDRTARGSKLFKARIERAMGSPEKAKDSDDSVIIGDSSALSESPRHTHTTLLSMRPVLDSNADVELSKHMINARRRQYWATKWVDPKKADATPDPGHVEKGQNADGLPVKVSSPDLSQHEEKTRATQTSTYSPNEASGATDSHVDSWKANGPDPGVDRRCLNTEKPANHGSPNDYPDVILAATGEDANTSSERAAGAYRHKKQFSFDAGEDGIPLLPLFDRVSTEHAANSEIPRLSHTGLKREAGSTLKGRELRMDRLARLRSLKTGAERTASVRANDDSTTSKPDQANNDAKCTPDGAFVWASAFEHAELDRQARQRCRSHPGTEADKQ